MAHHLKLPDIECFGCEPGGNRFMKHVDTESRRVQQVGPGEEFDTIAVFRCSKNRLHVRREAFDPTVA